MPPRCSPATSSVFETLCLGRLYVLFLIELGTRRVQLAGCTPNPDGAWTVQQARQLAWSLPERSEPIRFLIYDRDSKFSQAFDEVFCSEGVEIIRTPVSGAERERRRRVLGRGGPPRLSRLAPDREPSTARTCPARLCRALQHPQAASRARPETARTSTSPTARRLESARPDPATRTPRRPHQRTHPSSMTNGFTHPTGRGGNVAAGDREQAQRGRGASGRRELAPGDRYPCSASGDVGKHHPIPWSRATTPLRVARTGIP